MGRNVRFVVSGSNLYFRKSKSRHIVCVQEVQISNVVRIYLSKPTNELVKTDARKENVLQFREALNLRQFLGNEGLSSRRMHVQKVAHVSVPSDDAKSRY